MNEYNLQSVDTGEEQRFRDPSNYFYNQVKNYTTVDTDIDLKTAKKQDGFIVYEIVTAQGPYLWMGVLHNRYPNLVHMLDLVNQTHPKLFKLVNKKKALIHIDQHFEGFPLFESPSTYEILKQRDFYKELHNKMDDYGLDPSGILYSTSNLKEQEVYDDWCNTNGITKKINIFQAVFFAQMTTHYGYFNVHKRDAEILVQEHLEYKRTHNIKQYNCLNRIVRPHRVALMAMLHHYKLLDDCEVSMDTCSRHDMPTSYGDHPAYQEMEFEKFKKTLPIVLDDANFQFNKAQSFVKKIYLNTWYSVITETYFQDYYKTSKFLSEKIFKPIRARHPFVLASQPNSLQLLRELGFKTFSDVWDESYDKIENPTERLEAICTLISSLNKKTKYEWLELYNTVSPILEHNYKILMNTNWVNYEETIKGIV